MIEGTPERLLKWQVNGGLPIDHPAQDDIAWAGDTIAVLVHELNLTKSNWSECSKSLDKAVQELIEMEKEAFKTGMELAVEMIEASKKRYGVIHQNIATQIRKEITK
jgi:hypothetical protein